MSWVIRAPAPNALRDWLLGRAFDRHKCGKLFGWAAIAMWAVCVSLGIKAELSGSPLPPVFVSADAHGGPPTLVDFRSGCGAESSGLQVGDRLLSLGGRDLTGTGPLGLFVETAKAGRAGEAVDVTYRHGRATAVARLKLPSSGWIWRLLPFSLAWAALAILILTRSSWAQAPRFAFWASIGVALTAPLFGGGYVETILSAAALSLGAGAMAVYGLLFCIAFLSRSDSFAATAEKAGARTERWPWIFAAIAPLEASRDFGLFFPPAVGRIGFVCGVSLVLACALWRLTRRVRHASPIERRQLYWILFGLYWGVAPLPLATLLQISDPRFAPLYTVAAAIAGVLPVVWAFAVFRLNLLDVDRIISAATTYSIVAILLVAVGVYIGSLFSEGGSIVGDLAIAAPLIALSFPGYRWLRPSVDRLLFPERIRFKRGIERLTGELATCGEREQLWEITGLTLYRAVVPLSCAIYENLDDTAGTQEPIFHRGLASAAAIQRDGGLVAALANRRASFHLRPRRDIALTADERTALQTLQAAVIVPIHHGQRLHSFIVLGEKQSEDIYTASELAAFDTLSRSISRALDRLDESPPGAAAPAADQRTL